MANIGKIIKTGAVVLSAIGGTASLATEVVNQVNQYNEAVVVEEYNYEHQHIINIVDTYWVNDVQYTEAEWNNYLSNTNNAAVSLCYGAIDDYNNYNLSDLTSIGIISTTNEYSVTINANNQYTLFAVPESFTIASCKVSGFVIDIAELEVKDGYRIYSQPDNFEVWLQICGELTYTLTLK